MSDFSAESFELSVIHGVARWAYSLNGWARLPNLLAFTDRQLLDAVKAGVDSAWREDVRLGMLNILIQELERGLLVARKDVRHITSVLIVMPEPDTLLRQWARNGIQGPVQRGGRWGFATYTEERVGRAKALARARRTRS